MCKHVTLISYMSKNNTFNKKLYIKLDIFTLL